VWSPSVYNPRGLAEGQITTFTSWGMEGIATDAYLLSILARSLHRPVASPEGKAKEKLNKTGGAAVDRSFVKSGSGTFRIAVILPANQLGPG
jgi:hypothetical protein